IAAVSRVQAGRAEYAHGSGGEQVRSGAHEWQPRGRESRLISSLISRRFSGGFPTTPVLPNRSPLPDLRQPIRHPLRHRLVHQVMIEELLHPDREVLLIVAVGEVVRLAGIR